MILLFLRAHESFSMKPEQRQEAGEESNHQWLKQRSPSSILHFGHRRGASSGDGRRPAPPTAPMPGSYESRNSRNSLKKTVVIKVKEVKEKAKKLKQMISKRRHSHEEINFTPGEAFQPHNGSKEEVVAEQHHSPPDAAVDVRDVSASEKKSTVQVPVDTCTATSISDASDEEIEMEEGNNEVLQQLTLDNTEVKDITIPEIAEVPTGLSDDDPAIDDRPSSSEEIPVSKDSSSAKSSVPVYEKAAKQVWDTGISVKDYIMQKLEPGDEDKALCKVITEAVNTRTVGSASEETTTVKENNEAELGSKRQEGQL